MADRVIDRLVSSLASGLMGKDEFIQAVEGQASAMMSTSAEAAAAPHSVRTDAAEESPERQ
jgi:hypothetical protein